MRDDNNGSVIRLDNISLNNFFTDQLLQKLKPMSGLIYEKFIQHWVKNHNKIGKYKFMKKIDSDNTDSYGLCLDFKQSNKQRINNLEEINIVFKSEVFSPSLQCIDLNFWYKNPEIDYQAEIKNKKEMSRRDFFGNALDTWDPKRIQRIEDHYRKYYRLSLPLDYNNTSMTHVFKQTRIEVFNNNSKISNNATFESIFDYIETYLNSYFEMTSK